MTKRNFHKRLERLEALVPDTRVPEFMTLQFISPVTMEVVSSRVIELPPRRVGSKRPGGRRWVKW
jgi:hypothetical protein